MLTFDNLKAKGLINNTWFNAQTLEAYTDGLPCEEAAIDFEWCVSDIGARALAPLIGTAVCTQTRKSFVWLSDRWLNKNNLPQLCRVGPKVKHLIVHNLKADRTKIYEAYDLWESIEWTCTLSRNMVLAGCGGQQTWAHESKATFKPHFVDHSSPGSLVAVHNYWVPNSTLKPESKEIRQAFVDLLIPELRKMFTELLAYALKDPVYTLEVYEAMEAEWQRKFPSPVRQAAQKIRGRTSLCLAPWYKEWVASCERQYQEASSELNDLCKELLALKARDYQREIKNSLKEYDSYPPELLKKDRSLLKKYQCPIALNLKLNPDTLSVVQKWSSSYQSRPFEKWLPDSDGVAKCLKDPKLKYGSSLVQDLCSLTYYGQPVFYDPERKFCYLKPDGSSAKVFSPKKGPMTKDNCGSLFAKDFIDLFENGSIRSESPVAQKIVSKAAELSYWVSVRSRLFAIEFQQELSELTGP